MVMLSMGLSLELDAADAVAGIVLAHDGPLRDDRSVMNEHPPFEVSEG